MNQSNIEEQLETECMIAFYRDQTEDTQQPLDMDSVVRYFNKLTVNPDEHDMLVYREFELEYKRARLNAWRK